MFSYLKNLYKKINSQIVHGSENERMPYDEQMKYLNSLPNPNDDYERSYYKYRCFCQYCYYKRKWMIALYNIGAMLILPFLHWRLRKKSCKILASEDNYADAVIENISRLPCDDIIPDSLNKKYKVIKEINEINYSGVWISDQAENIIKELRRRYYFRFYFRVIVMMKLAQFAQYLDSYHPEAVIFYSCEREFSGPLQTKLCEMYGAKYISYMHGDYISTLSFAFQRFSDYYVWDGEYIDFFLELKCTSPMTVYTPKKLMGIAETIPINKCKYFATYYFSDETEEEIIKIKEVFAAFEEQGLRTKVRPHPRFSNLKAIHIHFKDIEIEDTNTCKLRDSITDSWFIVGLNTTVLSQSFFSGKQVVIDDISNGEKYKNLDKRRYIMMRREHITLSKLINDTKKYIDPNYLFYEF